MLADFAIPSTEAANVASRIDGDLAGMFFAGRGRTVHKWLHYLEIYERYFAKYRGTPVRMLEIGVSEGGSLDLWREYFGRDAVIFGIDVNPDCAGRVTAPNQVRIGSQDDPAFLCSVVDEMGPPDIILDDGSHVGRHQRTSFDTLFPLLADGGLYVIEDMHTSYWPDYEGGYRRAGTAVEFLKQMVDDLHGWYHRSPRATPARDWIKAMHVYDSIVVIEKGKVQRPGHIQIR
ncbi:MAG: hypothetical protein QOH81_1952 [Sphingomonadales bacterium]|nr:hypothetical protein [Sphingomonadales bacterium]